MQHKAERWYPGQDSHEYRLLGINLASGRGFSHDEAPPYAPALHHEPGYPAFVAAVFALTDFSDEAVAVAQVVVFSNRHRTPERLWLALIIGSCSLLSVAGDAQDRYGVPLVPFYTLFAAAGIVGLWDLILRRFTRRPALTAPAPS